MWMATIKSSKLDRSDKQSRLRAYSVRVQFGRWDRSYLSALRHGALGATLQSTSMINCRIFHAMQNFHNKDFSRMLLGSEFLPNSRPFEKFVDSLKYFEPNLNNSQKMAVSFALNRDPVTLIQVPPGTGKTAAIVEIIRQLSKLTNKAKKGPVLVVAASNVAIDNIAIKLLELGLPGVTRAVAWSKKDQYRNNDALSMACLHNDNLTPFERETERRLRKGDIRVGRKCMKEYYYHSDNSSRTIIGISNVVLTTKVTAGSHIFKKQHFPVVIMDENTQTNEAQPLISLSLRGVKKADFVGDDKQLGSFSNIPYLCISLLKRMIDTGAYRDPQLLNVQYRMHLLISEFPIREFYRGALTNGVTSEMKCLPGLNPLVFVDYSEMARGTRYCFERADISADNNHTLKNMHEVGLVIPIILRVMQKTGLKIWIESLLSWHLRLRQISLPLPFNRAVF